MAPPPLLFFLLAVVYTLSSAEPSQHLPIHLPFPRPPQPAALQHPLSLEEQLDASSATQPKPKYTAHYFTQTLDHFNFRPDSYKVFQHKYLLNSDHWDAGPNHSAPIFVYTGNEGNIEWFADNTGFLFDIAPRFNALLVFIEHRFYGDSKPFGNQSYKSAEELGYLSSTQALADYAVLTRSLKQNLSAEASPVVLFGGSYGGMLAAWFRLKYPHLATGAVASSAPILQFDNISPWSSFYDGVSQDFKDESTNCFNVIKENWDELMKQKLAQLTKATRSCKPLSSVYSVRNWLQTAFVYTAMVDYPMAANFLKPLPGHPVREMCRIIDTSPPGSTNLAKAIAAASLYYNYTGTQKTCFKVEDDTDEHGLSGWGWQACTEMIMPLTISNESMFQPSVFSYKDREKYCMSNYGVRPRPHWITTEFGGNRIEQTLKRFGSNIIFSNGMRDPWSRGGVLRNISDSLVALVTKEGAHHVDFRSATKYDPEWLVEQRSKEIEIIQEWINEYHAGYTGY